MYVCIYVYAHPPRTYTSISSRCNIQKFQNSKLAALHIWRTPDLRVLHSKNPKPYICTPKLQNFRFAELESRRNPGSEIWNSEVLELWSSEMQFWSSDIQLWRANLRILQFSKFGVLEKPGVITWTQSQCRSAGGLKGMLLSSARLAGTGSVELPRTPRRRAERGSPRQSPMSRSQCYG